jgi:hypothetical protein
MGHEYNGKTFIVQRPSIWRPLKLFPNVFENKLTQHKSQQGILDNEMFTSANIPFSKMLHIVFFPYTQWVPSRYIPDTTRKKLNQAPKQILVGSKCSSIFNMKVHYHGSSLFLTILGVSVRVHEVLDLCFGSCLMH